LTRAVRITPLAEADIAGAQDWYESKQPGLGLRFVEHVRATIQRIGQNPFQYQIAFENARRARVREFPYAVWYRVLDDESVVIACLAHRQDSDLIERRARLD
jgi:toxin ParE1/3/4